MDVVNELKRINKVQPLQHSACISRIAIGENQPPPRQCTDIGVKFRIRRSEEHTSELQSLMRISYAVFCLKKKTLNENIFRITKTRYMKQVNTAFHTPQEHPYTQQDE